jgi:hypothetical protein
MINKQRLTTWIVATLREAAWAPLSVVAFYAIGLTLHLFALLPVLDIPAHFAGGVAITYFYRVAIRQAQKLVGEVPVPVQVLLAFASTGTTTIFWEFYENLIDFFLGTHMVRGLGDTIVDLAVGLSGALVLSLFYRERK